MQRQLSIRRGVAAQVPVLVTSARPLVGVSRRSTAISAELTARGRAILPNTIAVERTMGEGSFGVVYAGQWTTPSGNQRVVLKRVKTSVEGAQQMGEMELLLNAYAAKVAKTHCADFLGYCEVAKEEATARLTPGLWLMWKFEGSRTLHYYLRRRDTLRALASDLEVAEEAVVATVMKQIFEALASFHAAGLVHRDIKPLNIIFAENLKRFKMIDLGACADLRTGTNYTPDESILDPNYCPPEQYVLPTDSPHLAKSFLKLAISPMLWAQHKPDRFDMWSAGITLLQLAVPAMRQDRVLKRFNQEYGPKYDYDLDAWRAGSYISARDFEILDADGGTGWELAKALLRPRSIRTLADNTVVFVNDNSLQRVSAGEALRHRFLKQAREPGSILDESISSSGRSAGQRTGSGGSRSGSGGGNGNGQRRTSGGSAAASNSGGRSGRRPAVRGVPENMVPELSGAGKDGRRTAGTFGAAVGLWRNLTNKLFDLEANIMVAASATEQQTTVVKQLQQKAVQGQVSKDMLQAEQKKLNSMEKDLTNLQDDFNKTANAVGNVLGFLGFGMTKPKAPVEPVKIKTEGINAKAPIKASMPNFLSRLSGSLSSSDEGDQKQYTANASSAKTSGGGGTAGIWAAVQQRLSDLEMKLTNQAVATERQVFTVKQLRVRVKTGQADETTLSRAEAILQKMERRVSELDKDLKATRQEATGLLGMLASSVNQMRGGSQDVKQQEASPPPAPQPAASSPPPATGSTTTGQGTSQTSGVGGFFGRMFGSNSASETPAPAGTGSAARQRPAAAKSASPSPAARESVQPVSGSQLQNAGLTAAQIGSGANNLIANSLKFTGMAAKVALGMAASMKADAEKVLRELEAEAEAKRVKKMTEQAFLRMLGNKQPPMQPSTTMAEVEEAFGQDTRYLAVEASQRMLLVAGFVDALQQAQQRTSEQAQAKLRDLFSLSRLGMTWEEAAAKYATNPVFLAVEDPSVRQSLFEEVAGALREAEENRLAAGLAEQAFLDLLQEVQPPISADSTWPRVKPLLWRDYRYLAVPEARRRELFEEMHAMVAEAAAAAAAAQAEKADTEAQNVAALLTAESAPQAEEAAAQVGISPSLLEELRSEQSRLRSEYDAMERKLREMESAMAAKERSAALLDERSQQRAPSRMPSRASTTPTAPRPPTSPTAARITTPSLQRGPPQRASGSHTPRPGQSLQHEVVPLRAPGTPRPANHAANAADATTLDPTRASVAAAATKGLVANVRSTIARMASPSMARITTPPLSRGPLGADRGAGMRRGQEEQVADSLEAAGVQYQRLKDGTLVFTFDGADEEMEGMEGMGGASPMAQVGATNGKSSPP